MSLPPPPAPGPPTAPRPGPPTDPWGVPPPPPPPPGRSRARRVLTLVAVLVVFLLVAATVLVLADGDDGGPDTATSPGPSTGNPPASAQSVDEVIAELQAFVERARGQTFTSPVDVEVLDQEEYERRTRQDFDQDLEEDRAEIESAAAQYEALGLLDPDVDIIEVLQTFYSTATAGYYDAETDELVVLGDEVTPALKGTLVHELTHALDDQAFDLDRPELDEVEDESGFTFSAVVEGSASTVEAAYVQSLPEDEQLAYFQESADNADGVDLDAFPPVLLLEQMFVYGNGTEFVIALVEDSGQGAIDAALRTPPATTEEVLEPDTYLADEDTAQAVPTPDADGEVVDEGVGGQFLLELLVNGTLDEDGVPEWDGDRYVAWEQDGETCVSIAYRGDPETFAEALAAWADRAGGRLDRDGDGVTITGCTA